MRKLLKASKFVLSYYLDNANGKIKTISNSAFEIMVNQDLEYLGQCFSIFCDQRLYIMLLKAYANLCQAIIWMMLMRKVKQHQVMYLK